MSYTVLARKYRPQTFEDLVGQEHVTKTLANAITQGRVAHAFLFTGVRGVGKTTSARILAKALNCATGPTPVPCNACDACREIASATAIDVIEIDGASNNSVDDVRRLQETLPFRPARDRFKVVIVDEVHMLSAGAFNAFLKTLEEPPSHVKFIFATTEIHKVPVTIRSRCQRYDFRLVGQATVAARVREILAKEKIEADDAAVALVARESGGSMRDALTLLDQVIAQGGSKIRGADVVATLGVADRTLVRETIGHLLAGDGAAVLRTVHAVVTQGIDLVHFVKQLTDLMRDLVVLQVVDKESSLVEATEEERASLIPLLDGKDALELQRTFATVAQLVDDVAGSSVQRPVLEMGLVRIATRPPLRSIADVIARLESGGGGNSGSGGQARTPPRSAPSAAPVPSTSRTAPAAADARPRAAPPAVTAPSPSAPPHDHPAAPPADTAEARSAPASLTAPAGSNTGAVPGSAPGSGTESGPESASTAAAEPAAESRPASVPPRDDLESIPPANASTWERIVARVREMRPALGAVLDHAAPIEVTAKRIVLSFPEGSFFRDQADVPDAREAVVAASKEILDATPKLELVASGTGPKPATIAELEGARKDERRADTRRKALTHPHVVDALKVFPESVDAVRVEIDD